VLISCLSSLEIQQLIQTHDLLKASTAHQLNQVGGWGADS